MSFSIKRAAQPKSSQIMGSTIELHRINAAKLNARKVTCAHQNFRGNIRNGSFGDLINKDYHFWHIEEHIDNANG